MTQLLGIFGGIFAGLVWEILATSPYQRFMTLVPSLFVKHARETLHIHHWILYFIGLVIVTAWAYKTSRLAHPAILFIIFFLVAALAYNFWKFPDWFKFFK